MINRRASLVCALVAGLGLFGAGAVVGANRFGKPKSIVHVITFKYKPEVTDAQKMELMRATEKLAADFPGLKNVWMKAVKVQGPDPDFKNAIVMEFADKAAFDAYADHAAHREWEKAYLPLRGESRTHDITND